MARTETETESRRTAAAARAQRSRSTDCRCGQELDLCARAHCPRCGRSLRRR